MTGFGVGRIGGLSALLVPAIVAGAAVGCLLGAMGIARAHPLTPVSLQQLIDTTESGGTLALPPAFYVGPAVVRRPMRIVAAPGAILDGRGAGTVLTIEADDVAVSGLLIRNSGDRNDGIDAGLRLAGRRAVIEDNSFEDCLYGIRLEQADDNIVRRNRIGSKDLPEARRGDAVRVWYSTGNLFEANEITGVRDGFGMQAVGNRLFANTVRDSRYGVQLLYGNGNEIAGNRLLDNAVGIMAIASDDLVVTRNAIRSGRDVAGQAIILKDSSRALVADNDLFANAVAIYLDAAPVDADNPNRFRANRFTFNGTSVLLHADLTGNLFEDNVFRGNHAEVVVDGGGSALRNRWRGNDWDAFDGFDRDGDGIGDTAFEVWSWADRLWMDLPAAQLFRASPSLVLIDVVDRLASLTEPRLLLRDEAPHVPIRIETPALMR